MGTQAGATVLMVESSDGFSVGDAIQIAGGGNSETNSIARFGSIVLVNPTTYGYPAGSVITKVAITQAPIPESTSESTSETESSLSFLQVAAIVLGVLVVAGWSMALGIVQR